MKNSGKIIFTFILSTLVLISVTLPCFAQEEPSELRTMLSWFPEVYEGGSVYKHFVYINIISVREKTKTLYTFGWRRNSRFMGYPKTFRDNVSHALEVKAFSSGFRSMNALEKVSMIKHLKTRKDIPDEIKAKLAEDISSDESEDREILWEPKVLRLTNGNESLQTMLKAGLLQPTGESLEGYPIYKLGKKLKLNREPVNWAWFDGQDTLITSNIIGNLALMIYTNQGSEPSVLDVKEFKPFWETGSTKNLIDFFFSNAKGIQDYQYRTYLERGIPAKELEPMKNDFEKSYQYSLGSTVFNSSELTSTDKHFFPNINSAKDELYGENWYKQQVKSKKERYAGIVEIKREGTEVCVTSNYSGEKLEKYIERILVSSKEELKQESINRRESGK